MGKLGNSNTSGELQMFQGATALNLDAKGRLAVPTRHRDALQSSGVSKQVLTAHPHRCVLLYPAPAWEPIRARIMSFSSFDAQTSLWKRLLVGFAEEVELDASGRLLISPELPSSSKPAPKWSVTRPSFSNRRLIRGWLTFRSLRSFIRDFLPHNSRTSRNSRPYSERPKTP